MKTESLDAWISGLEQKLGEETSAIVADELTNLITENSKTQDELSRQEKRIKELESTNKKLVHANAELLHSRPVIKEKDIVDEDDPKPTKEFSFREQFDKNGKFIN